MEKILPIIAIIAGVVGLMPQSSQYFVQTASIVFILWGIMGFMKKK